MIEGFIDDEYQARRRRQAEAQSDHEPTAEPMLDGRSMLYRPVLSAVLDPVTEELAGPWGRPGALVTVDLAGGRADVSRGF